MTEHERTNISEQLQVVEMALRPQGVLHEIAQAGLEEPLDLTPQEAGDVILKRNKPGEELDARWKLLEDANPKIIEAANARAEAIYELAEQFGNRKAESLSDEEIAAIDGDKAVWEVESGANKTSIVRRVLEIAAMKRVYGKDEIEDKELFQFGSATNVPCVHPDGNPNGAHKIAQEIAPDFLTKGEDFTEFGLNLATALQSGYEVIEDVVGGPAADRCVRLYKPGNPKLILIQPAKHGELSGTEDGFTAVASLVGDLSGKQLVIATNGQYRFKVELQARRWAASHGLSMLPPVVLGDESGYTVEHNGATLTTAARGPMVYLNDFIVLSRMAEQS